MKKIKLTKVLILFVVMLVISPAFYGCSRTGVTYSVVALPNKLVYQIGETPNYEGLKIDTINNDGTHKVFRYAQKNISEVDTSTPGTKKVKVESEDISVSFDIYVANVVVNDSDDLKSIFAELNDGDVVYVRAGNYFPQNNQDTRYKDVVINKSVTIVGDGTNKTRFGGNFIVGATLRNGVFNKIDNFENVKLLDIGFELENKVANGMVEYTGPYGTSDTNGAINLFDTSSVLISRCSFNGYGYGILANSTTGSAITNCKFEKIYNSGIRVNQEISNSTIANNVFLDIASNVVAFNGEKQAWLGGVVLNFETAGQKGVIISKNSFNKIGIHNGAYVYFNQESKQASQNTSANLSKMYYMNNTSAVILLSSTVDDLDVDGVILSSNNYTNVYESLYMGAKSTNTINQNGIIITE